jgi:hypothetical protein
MTAVWVRVRRTVRFWKPWPLTTVLPQRTRP